MTLKDIVEPEATRDDIDRIVDALLENPTRAGDIKTLLRQKMTAPEVVRVARAVAAERPNDDVEDFWDNVPV
ncbi:MAG: hypothetical protein QNJ13_05645 [Paracoccaceae bacterium]|nr:hypothetical protein [Paracoccaceae bacterium]